jgi:hypothetical protein
VNLSLDTISIVFCMLPVTLVWMAVFWRTIWQRSKPIFILGSLAGCSGIYQIWSRLIMIYMPFYVQVIIAGLIMFLVIIFNNKSMGDKPPKR